MSRRDALDDLEEEEEDDEEYDDEEDEEEEDNSRKRPSKKKAKSAASYYLDEEAEVDDDDDEEFDGEEDMGLIAGDGEDLDDGGASSRAAHAHHRMSMDRSMGMAPRGANRLEAIAKKYEQGGGYEEAYDDDEEEYLGEDSAISQQSLLPSVRDPKLWMMTCKVGKEREIALTIMQKFIDKENAPDRLLVKSVVCPDHLKGHVYIEADKESHVREAIKGVRELFSWKIKLVPIKEMTDVLTVTRKPVHLEKNSWVRVKRGVYRGDIAQVYEFQESKGRATIKLIPRLDLSKKPEDTAANDDPTKRKRKVRPPQRFIDDDDIKQLHGSDFIDHRRDSHTGEMFSIYNNAHFKDGYIYKLFNLKSLEVHDVVPTLDELQKFQEKRDDEDEEGAAARLPITMAPINARRKTIFAKGDTVRVVEGDLRHLMGVVETVDEDMVTIMPKHQDLHDLLTFPSSQLQKFFKEGDHCKVIAGQYDGETGLIVKVENNIVTLLSDLSMKEIRVLASDIQECTEVTSGRMELGSYELHDLVQVGSSVGCIVKIERDSFRILDTGGHVQIVKLQEMGNKRNNKNATSFDSHRNPVVQNDLVAIQDGLHKGRTGSVKHVYRYNAFVYCKEVLENGGIIVVKCAHLNLLGGKKNGPMGMSAPQQRPMTPNRGPRDSSGGHRGGSSQRGRGGRSGPHSDPLYRQTIIITKGSWKGYLGIVKEVTDSTARVELHTNCKTINVAKTHLQVANSNRSHGSSDGMSHFPPATPSAYTRTPSREDMPSTPMRHATPSHLGMPGTPSRDPFNPAIPNTPRPHDTPRTSWDEDWGNVSTPRSAHTPVPSTPSTPGSYPYSSSYYNPSTPLSHTPQTPSGYMPGYDRPTPQDSTPHTPFSSTPTPSTPHTPGSGLGIPQTPHTPSTPSTPGSALGSHESYYGDTSDHMMYEDSHATPQTPHTVEEAHVAPSQWHAPRLYAKVSGSFKSGLYDACVGIIQEVLGDQSRVTLPDRGNENITVPNEMLEAVPPAKRDRLKVVAGKFSGECGSLVGVYGNDGIVKMDVNLEITILPLTNLAKLAP